MAVVWSIPVACNRASADFLISSPLMGGEYLRTLSDHESYAARRAQESSPDALQEPV